MDKHMNKIWKIGLIAMLATEWSVAETAEQAWEKSVAPILMKRSPESFRYVENNPALPNVFIYGDSISIAYTPVVRKQLVGAANVYRLNRNGDWSGRLISFVKELEEAMRNPALEDPWTFDWNVIVFNTGLHDLKYLNGQKLDTGNGSPQCPPDAYAENLRKNVRWLRSTYPKTKLVFVTTTPVPEGAVGRIPGDAAKYNEVARNVLKEFPEVAVVDLYDFTKPHQPDWCKNPGDVHYNLSGVAAQGEWLAKQIRPLLNQ